MLIIDGHVHIYDQFELNRFFASAFANFAGAARSLGARTYQPVMFLADWPGKSWFETLRAQNRIGAGAGVFSDRFFQIESTDEPISLIVRGRDSAPVTVIAAQKIITAENIEVMALFAAEPFATRQPLGDTVARIREKGAVAVLPWAVGKWLGKRGREIKTLLGGCGNDVFLADNANRPWFWPRPRHFARARRMGADILAGSDPLDLASETDRAGRFGFALHGELAPGCPARGLKQTLLNASGQITRYGSLETGVRFVRNQVAIRLLKKSRRENA
ncbi:MAG: hypothetical protein KFF46_01870 [Desulfobacterales bacterium]|nr:hypothetical protein [Desulfobacterales bacterium]